MILSSIEHPPNILRFEAIFNENDLLIKKYNHYWDIHYGRSAKHKINQLMDIFLARDLLPKKLWKVEVLLYDPKMNKQTKEKTIKYANVNFWRGIAGKNNRSYNYHILT